MLSEKFESDRIENVVAIGYNQGKIWSTAVQARGPYEKICP